MDKAALRRMVGISQAWFRRTEDRKGYEAIDWKARVAVLLIALIATAIGLAIFISLERTAFAAAVSLTTGVILFCGLLLSTMHFMSE